MILSCLREYRRNSLDQIAELTKLPKNKLTVSLEQLVERGTIEAVGKGKTRSFMLCKRYYYNNVFYGIFDGFCGIFTITFR